METINKMTNLNQENNLESSAKNGYTDKDNYLEMFRPLLSEILNSDTSKNLSSFQKNNSVYYIASFYRTFV